MCVQSHRIQLNQQIRSLVFSVVDTSPYHCTHCSRTDTQQHALRTRTQHTRTHEILLLTMCTCTTFLPHSGYLNMFALPPNENDTLDASNSVPQRVGRPAAPPGDIATKTVAARNQVQKYMVEGTRLGIPVSFIMETLHSGANDGTIFPMPINFGSSWNLTAMEAAARVIADEARAIGAGERTHITANHCHSRDRLAIGYDGARHSTSCPLQQECQLLSTVDVCPQNHPHSDRGFSPVINMFPDPRYASPISPPSSIHLSVVDLTFCVQECVRGCEMII